MIVRVNKQNYRRESANPNYRQRHKQENAAEITIETDNTKARFGFRQRPSHDAHRVQRINWVADEQVKHDRSSEHQWLGKKNVRLEDARIVDSEAEIVKLQKF